MVNTYHQLHKQVPNSLNETLSNNSQEILLMHLLSSTSSSLKVRLPHPKDANIYRDYVQLAKSILPLVFSGQR